MQKLRVNDKVVILAGKDKNKTGSIKKINFKTNRVVVEGINLVQKTMKPTQQNPQGGFAKIENSIHISNVALMSPKTSKATRVVLKTQGDKKVRVAKKCGSEIK